VADGVSALLTRIDALGGYFRIQPGAAPVTDGWRPLRELVTPPEQLSGRMATARRGLAAAASVAPADVDLRAAASAVHLGLVARLVSPVVAAAVIGDTVLDLHPDRTWWRPPADGEPSFSLRMPQPTGVAAPAAAGQAEAFARFLLAPVLLPLEDALYQAARVSRHVLRGNLVSALNGAATVLVGTLPTSRRPAERLLRALLQVPELAGTGWFDEGGQFHRRSCCLFYRVPGGGLCGDCILVART
jgi:ferric iron reductase protein FhuF